MVGEATIQGGASQPLGWGDFLNRTAQDYIVGIVTPQPAPPTMINPATGSPTPEGKPAASGGVKGMLSNPMVLVGGAVAIGLVAFLVLRK